MRHKHTEIKMQKQGERRKMKYMTYTWKVRDGERTALKKINEVEK